MYLMVTVKDTLTNLIVYYLNNKVESKKQKKVRNRLQLEIHNQSINDLLVVVLGKFLLTEYRKNSIKLSVIY